MSGDPVRALAAATDAVEHHAAYDRLNTQAMALSTAAICRAAVGDIPRAVALSEQAQRHASGGAPFHHIWHRRASGWIAAASGDHQAAIEHALDAGEAAMGTDDFAWAILTLHDATRWGGAAEVLDPMRRLSDRISGAPYFEEMIVHTEAAAAHDPDALMACGDRFAGFGAWYAAGAAYGNAGVTCSDETLGRRRASTAVALVGPMPLDPAVRTLALSARQIDVALRAADGKSSREIGDELFLSARTVDNHLRDVYRHLGLSGRQELAAVLPVEAVARRSRASS